MQASHNQHDQAQSLAMQDPIASPGSSREAQQGEKAPGPGIQHPNGSLQSSEHARQHDSRDRPLSAQHPSNFQSYVSEYPSPSRYRRYRQGFGRRFADYLHLIWRDMLFIVLLSAISGILHMWAPLYRLGYRSVPLWYDPIKSVWYGPLSLSCQRNGQPDVITSTATGLVVLFVPLGVIILVQLFTRSFWDAHHAKFGLIKALAIMTIIQEALKRFLGAKRPYFMAACNPQVPSGVLKSPYSPTWFRVLEVCPNVTPNAMQSFPSGHTGSAFTVGTFLALYLNAKLKAFSNYHTSFWKHICVVAPLFGAAFIGLGMIVDCNHHAHDVLLSMLLGIFCGLLGYRAHFHSLFDYRNNHIPLPYHGQTRSFKIVDAPLNTLPKSKERGLADEKQPYESNNPVPDKHLAVRWPFGSDEKRGSDSTKVRIPKSEKDTAPEVQDIDMGSGSGRMAMDGNSSVIAVCSTRIRSSTELGSVIHHKIPVKPSLPSYHTRMDDTASIRDRELIGSGTGSEVAEMV